MQACSGLGLGLLVHEIHVHTTCVPRYPCTLHALALLCKALSGPNSSSISSNLFSVSLKNRWTPGSARSIWRARRFRKQTENPALLLAHLISRIEQLQSAAATDLFRKPTKSNTRLCSTPVLACFVSLLWIVRLSDLRASMPPAPIHF